MKTTKVLVANRPRLLRELLLNTISEAVDMEVVGEVFQESDLASAVGRTHPDCVIVALENANELPERCTLLLREFPNLKVIAISADGNSLKYYWSQQLILSEQIEASEAAVLGALRGLTSPNARLQ